ncbi:hypothetical protein CHARACLAT_016134 [Characodon lateralis]|uniref:Uncharacterized protein n=1 Tax=Characodon lateralis TaxID=208331 RepID=A0ABU7DH29_9TELE|nr:hypothetical protein [Characodon lateralis]
MNTPARHCTFLETEIRPNRFLVSFPLYFPLHVCFVGGCVVQAAVCPRMWCAGLGAVCYDSSRAVLCGRDASTTGAFSWPGFLTQRFLYQITGPDTNFLAEHQCGPSGPDAPPTAPACSSF